MNLRKLALSILLLSIVLPYARSQTAAPTLAASALTAVPPLVPYSGQVEGRTGQTSATFLIYKDQTGGEPLFTESQIVSLDPTGHYKVQLGAANPNGLPFDLFATGEARWLEVQIAGQPAEPRTLLASVPYALKAADAATLGGLPASAFALAGSNTAVANVLPGGVSPDAVTTVTTTGGTTNKVAKFSGANTIVNSILYDNGTEVGIGTTSPTATLTVDGTIALDGATTFNGAAVLGATGTATSTHSYSSQLLKAYTSAYNSSTKAVVQPRFEWQAEVKGNNTSTPAGTLNLLESNTAAGAAETGFYFNANGTIHFAPGQTFEGSTTAGPGVEGISSLSYGVEGSSTSNIGVEGSSSSSVGVYGTSAFNAGVEGTSDSVIGVYGSSTNGTGVKGLTSSTLEADAGVVGINNYVAGIDVLGYNGVPSSTWKSIRDLGFGAGVWGDSSIPESEVGTFGVMGTADDDYAGYFQNNSLGLPALLGFNTANNSEAEAARMGGNFGFCSIDTSGNLTCNGSKSAVVPVDNNTRKVALYAVESPENWFEDFGSGQLSNGVAMIEVEPTFAQTVNLDVDYHVFLTPKGDSKGLYISRTTPTSFEVRESVGGHSTFVFDYRIVARRKGYETVRLADKTKEMDHSQSPLIIASQRAKQTKP